MHSIAPQRRKYEMRRPAATGRPAAKKQTASGVRRRRAGRHSWVIVALATNKTTSMAGLGNTKFGLALPCLALPCLATPSQGDAWRDQKEPIKCRSAASWLMHPSRVQAQYH